MGRKARIGFSLVLVDRIWMAPSARIGHLNYLNIRRVIMRKGAYLGRMNALNGPFSLWLDEQAALGNANKVVRGPTRTVTVGPSYLRLGRLTKITSNHRVDCTRSVSFGDYCTLAGIGSMIWTHGYVHDAEGPGRYRIDGSVVIGDNVNIGAGSILSMGIRITSGVMIGAGCTIARNLAEPGLYVSSAIRKLPIPQDPDGRVALEPVVADGLVERVYLKRIQ